MNGPLVSVVVATYRRKEPLSRALESLAQQTWPSIEIILVDDSAELGWNQTVADIATEFRMRYPEHSLRIITNETNRGSAETRNIGIRAAQGDYITFLDDDDLYLPEKITHQVMGMMEAGADYSITDLHLFSEKNVLIERRVRSYINATDKASLLSCHLMHHMTGTDVLMFRREYLLNIGGFPPINLGDEFYLMERAICGGGVFCYLPGCYVTAYVHSNEQGLSSGAGKIEGENKLYEYKSRFFDQLKPSAVRYIKMRHHAVLAFAYLRMKDYGRFVSASVHSFLCAPIACAKLFLQLR